MAVGLCLETRGLSGMMLVLPYPAHSKSGNLAHYFCFDPDLISFRLNHVNNVKVPETGSSYLYKVHNTKIWAVGGIWRKHMVSMKGAGWCLDFLGHLVFSCSESLMIYSVIKK